MGPHTFIFLAAKAPLLCPFFGAPREVLNINWIWASPWCLFLFILKVGKVKVEQNKLRRLCLGFH